MEFDIVKLTEQVIENTNQFDDWFDKMVEPFKDITDTAQDLFTPIKVASALYSYNKTRKFKNFLKSYSEGVKGGGIKVEEDYKKLEKYLENKKNYDLIHSCIENAIQSKSLYGTILLGYFAGSILSLGKEITYDDLVIVNALGQLNDYEISYFTKICVIVGVNNGVNIHDYKESFTDVFSVEATIPKLIFSGLADQFGMLVSGYSKGLFKINSSGEQLYYGLIKGRPIETDLLNFE